MKNFTFLIVCLLFSVFSNAQESKWYKGNLHTHSYWSDGDEVPEMIIKWYKNRDYQFLALSDHNILAEGEKWKTIPNDSLHIRAFRDYLDEYGENWVTYKEDTAIHVKLKTLEEFVPEFVEPEEFMLLKAEEVTTYLDDKAVHMGAVNIQNLIPPQKGENIVELIQNNLNAIEAEGEKTGEPVLQHLNHPNFFYSIKADDIIQLDDERFFEVYNGHPYVNNYGDSIHDSTEEIWDKVNIAYANMGKQLLLGIATDDSHHYHQFGSRFSNAGRGWVVVKAENLTPAAIIENLEKGNFYASTGVRLKDIKLENNVLQISIDAEKDINYKIEFIGVHKGSTQSEVLKTIEGTAASYQIPEDILFVRAKIISDKPKRNPNRTGDTEVAWTQPVSNNKE